MPATPRLTAENFHALGLYEPTAPDAAKRLELLEYLVSVGATAEDLLTYRDQLPGLPTILAVRGGPPLTLPEAAAQAGVDEQKLLAISRAAGFPQPGPEDRVFDPHFAGLAGGLAASEAVFGADAVLGVVRVMGSTMARLADAIVSAFLVNVDPGLSEEDPVGLRVAQANARASSLLPTVAAALDVILRQHLLAARRSSLGLDAALGFETRWLCVGFVDLVESTALAQSLPTNELGALLAEFERVAADVVTSAGGRVVKLIGDEILYTTTEAPAACAIALRLSRTFCEHSSIPPVRAGLAAGEVTLRDGDVFGPVVNLAARIVKAAAPSAVVSPQELARAAGLASEPLGRRRLRGMDEDVELCRLLERPG